MVQIKPQFKLGNFPILNFSCISVYIYKNYKYIILYRYYYTT